MADHRVLDLNDAHFQRSVLLSADLHQFFGVVHVREEQIRGRDDYCVSDEPVVFLDLQLQLSEAGSDRKKRTQATTVQKHDDRLDRSRNILLLLALLVHGWGYFFQVMSGDHGLYWSAFHIWNREADKIAERAVK